MNQFILNIYLKIFPLRFMRYHSFRIEEFVKNISEKYDRPDKKLLDIGAENSPYKKYFNKVDYYSHDFKQNKTKSINYIGDLNKGLPQIKKNQFDYILCTQVLEHLIKPDMAFAVFQRILKPGGRLFLTTHLCFEEHMQPNDFFRFTRYGLKYLGESNGFKLEYIAPQGGIFHLLSLILTKLPIKLFLTRDTFLYYAYILLFSVPILLLNMVCYALDNLDRKKEMTINYECIYVKSKKNQ